MADLDLGNLIAHLRLDAKQFNSMLNTAEKKLKHSAEQMERIGRSLTRRVTAPIIAMSAVSVKAFASFDDAITKSAAIMSDVTADIREEMEKTALTISKRSVTSATDLAKSYFFLASAGLSAKQSIAALATVERFAVAGAFDMALATDLLTDAQSVLGLTVDDATKNMENMEHVADVLTGANTLANASTLQFSKALTSQAGPAMKAYKIQLEEGVAVLAAYADQGIKAEEAGNMFSRMLRLMTKGFIDNRAAWERLNIQIFDSRGALKPMFEIINDLSGALNRMSTEQKIVTLNMLGFQARSQQAILPLLGLGGAIEEYQNKLEKMSDITKRIAEKQLMSFASQMKILWGNIKAVGISIGRILAPRIKAIGETILRVTKWWEGLSEATQTFIIDMALIAAATGPVLLIMGKMIQSLIMFKVAMFAAAGATTALTSAFLLLGTAIASWRLGKWARENFEPFAIWMEKLAETIMASWIHIKFAIKDAILKIREFWSKGIALLKLEWASFLISIQKSLGFWEAALGKDLGFEKLGEHIKAMNKSAVEGLADTSKEIERNVQEYDRQMAFLVETTDQAIEDIKSKFESMAEGTNVSKESIAELKKELEDLQGQLQNIGEGVEQNVSGVLETKLVSLNDWITSSTDLWARFSDVAVGAFNGLADSISNAMITGKANFKQLTIGILSELNKMIIKMMLAKALMAAFGLVNPTDTSGITGSPDFVGPLKPNALGNVFSMGKQIMAFAKGGIVGQATLAPMALMGEKGPEAIMPLTRGASGELGVKAMQPNVMVEPKFRFINILDKREMANVIGTEEGETEVLNVLRRNRII